MLSKAQFLVLADSGYTQLAQLNGTKIGVIGGIFHDYLSHAYTGKFRIILYSNIDDLIDALNSKNIAAAFVDSATVKYWLQSGNQQFVMFNRPVDIDQGLAIMTLPSKLT